MLSFFKKHSTITAYFLLTILALQILRGFFQPGIFNSYDTLYRLARTAKYYLALREGQLLPRWIGDVDSGVGSPIFTYLYPFPYLVTTIFHLLKFNLMDAQKIPWMIFFIISGWSMYAFLVSFVPKRSAFVGAVFYEYVSLFTTVSLMLYFFAVR